MLAQTLSFLRRLTGRPAPARDAEGDEDRRHWARIVVDLPTTVQATDAQSERAAGTIRNISRGGASLLVDAPFRPGQMIGLELPTVDAPDELHQLLACVVRGPAQVDGRFEIGCVFSRELTDEDLVQFGAWRRKHAPEDLRTWMRFECDVKATFQRVGPFHTDAYASKVVNVSASGIGLEVGSPIEIGALLNVRVIGKRNQETTLLACVVHSANVDGAWRLGCNFIRELSETDFQQIL